MQAFGIHGPIGLKRDFCSKNVISDFFRILPGLGR